MNDTDILLLDMRARSIIAGRLAKTGKFDLARAVRNGYWTSPNIDAQINEEVEKLKGQS